MQIKYLLVMNHVKQFGLIVVSRKKWPKNVSGLKNDTYEFGKNFQIFCIFFRIYTIFLKIILYWN